MVTHLPVREVIKWCEANTSNGWNVIADSYPAPELDWPGGHYVAVIFESQSDLTHFSLTWL